MLHVWYIYLHDWVILFGQMLVNIPYMKHMGIGYGKLDIESITVVNCYIGYLLYQP